MKDPVLRDSKLAAGLFFLGAAGLLLGATLGLNTWPAQALVAAALQGSGKDLFLAFHGYAIVLAVLFWGAAPSPIAQRTVLLGWVATTAILWMALHESMPMAWADMEQFPMPMFLATTLAIPSSLALLWRVSLPAASGARADLDARLRWLVVLAVLFMMVPLPALNLTANLHPHTFDLFALHWDRVAGLGFTPTLIATVDAVPGLRNVLGMAYGMTPVGLLAVALLHLRGRPPHVASALLLWVGLTSCAIVAYHLFPITGPKYLFGSDHFVAALRDGANQPLDLTLIDPYPRNGMPSMHFGWMLAAAILWWRSGTKPLSRAIMVLFASCTAVATIYTGEHYVVDLIVAVPFVLGAIGLCTTSVPWTSRARQSVVVLGFATWFVWVMLLRHQLPTFIENPWLCQLMMAATALVVALQARAMARFASEAIPILDTRTSLAVPTALTSLHRRFGVMFFASGAAALVYQVLFAKELALVFGSTSTATFTVLATFLGGMAIGSLLGGLLAHRISRPLVAYAGVEVAIAVYCVATPLLFEAIQSGYVAAAAGLAPDSSMLLVLRVALGASVLLVPTVLMGTTLPLLAHAIGPQAGRLGSRVAWLYFANTAGAALGALLTAYFVIPALGAHRTTLVAAVLNLMVALGALEIAKQAIAPTPVAAADEPGSMLPMNRAVSSLRARWAALLALGLGGVLSLGLEVVYIHMLSIVAGNSVYAFGLMVATFLVGLSLGGELARRVLLWRRAEPAFGLMVALLGLSASAALGALSWNSIPDYFASFANYPAARSFGSREAIRGLVCALVMIPPTFFIGAAYVMAMDIVTASGDETKSVALGVGAAVNTLGNILGVLLFGFVLLPAIGGFDAGRVIAVGAFALALLVMVLAVRIRWSAVGTVAASLLVLLATSAAKLNYETLSSGANVYFHPQRWGTVIDHAESIDGGLTAVVSAKSDSGTVLTLLTNGKFQGNDAVGGEMQAQVGFALAPLLHQDKRDRALVIGYGTGVTSRVFHEAGFREVEIAELSRDIVRLADEHFESVNRRVSQAPGVKLHITDGRNLLLLSDKRYDVISLEITSIWFAGAASLYNQEFYQLARSKMNPDGVLQQWMQLHHLSPIDLLQIVASIRSEFKYVSLYVMGGQGILVATNAVERASPTPQALRLLDLAPQLADARRIVERPVEALTQQRLLSADGIDRFLTEVGIEPTIWISTDDNLRLEYDTPKANVNDSKASFATNLAMLTRFRDASATSKEP